MDERTVLIDFYDSTYGQQWIRNWNLQQPITSWFGVVTNDNGSVTGLTLPGNNLGGNVPKHKVKLIISTIKLYLL